MMESSEEQKVEEERERGREIVIYAGMEVWWHKAAREIKRHGGRSSA